MSHSALIDLSSVRVLCVDEDPVMRSVIRTALQRRGCRDVAQAHGGMEALDLCAGRAFDLIVCDMHMRPMNGLDFLRALHDSGLAANRPVIMLSADTDPAAMRDTEGLGVSAWVGKPVSVHTLIERISAVLRMSGQIGAAVPDGELLALSERCHARLMATLTAAGETANSLTFRPRDAASLAHTLRQMLDDVNEQARSLGFGLVALLAGRAEDLVGAMIGNPAAAARGNAGVAKALVMLFTAMKRIAQNRMAGDGAEGGLKLLEKVDGIVDGVRSGLR